MPGKRKATDSDSDSDSVSSNASSDSSEPAEFETYIWGDVYISNPSTATRIDQVLDFPVHLPGFSDFKTAPKQIVSGYRHTLILGQNSKVYGWGCNAYGQLGVEPKKLPQSYEWIPIKALDKKRVVEIACGAHHCLARTDLGMVFTWGSNSKGQCGISLTRPQRVEPKTVKMSQATSITASGNTSYATDTEGDFYVWGYGGDGQCCAEPPPGGCIPKPTKIPTFETTLKVEVEEIAAGPQHVIVRSGMQIYTSGFGELGRLGTGNIRSKEAPTEIKINEESGEKNFRLGSGPEASFVISDIKGRSVLRGWGRVGPSSTDTSVLPMDIQVPVGIIKCVDGGKQFHSMLLDDGTVWNWGQKSKALLGRDYDMRERRHVPQMAFCLEGKHVVAMSCSSTYEIVVVDQSKSVNKNHLISIPFFGRYTDVADRLAKKTINFETSRKQFTRSYESNAMCDNCSEASIDGPTRQVIGASGVREGTELSLWVENTWAWAVVKEVLKPGKFVVRWVRTDWNKQAEVDLLSEDEDVDCDSDNRWTYGFYQYWSDDEEESEGTEESEESESDDEDSNSNDGSMSVDEDK